MKIFRAVFFAIDQTDGEIKRFDWKPVFANSIEDAQAAMVAYPFVRIVGEDKEFVKNHWGNVIAKDVTL